MTTKLDRTLPATVLSLIARLGVTATLTANDFAYDPIQRANDGAATNYTLTVSPLVPVVSDLGSESGATRKIFDCWVAAKDIAHVPKPGDSILVSSRSMVIREVEAFYSGTLPAAYHLTGEA